MLLSSFRLSSDKFLCREKVSGHNRVTKVRAAPMSRYTKSQPPSQKKSIRKAERRLVFLLAYLIMVAKELAYQHLQTKADVSVPASKLGRGYNMIFAIL